MKEQYDLLKIDEESKNELKLLYYRNKYLTLKILFKIWENIKEGKK